MRRALLLAVVGLAVSAPAATALPPVITPTVTGQTGDSGWYVRNVIVNWSITPPGYLVVSGCAPSTLVASDTAGTNVSCVAATAMARAHRERHHQSRCARLRR